MKKRFDHRDWITGSLVMLIVSVTFLATWASLESVFKGAWPNLEQCLGLIAFGQIVGFFVNAIDWLRN